MYSRYVNVIADPKHNLNQIFFLPTLKIVRSFGCLCPIKAARSVDKMGPSLLVLSDLIDRLCKKALLTKEIHFNGNWQLKDIVLSPTFNHVPYFIVVHFKSERSSHDCTPAFGLAHAQCPWRNLTEQTTNEHILVCVCRCVYPLIRAAAAKGR